MSQFLRFCFVFSFYNKCTVTNYNEVYLNNFSGKIAVFYVRKKIVVPCTRFKMLLEILD